MVFLSSPERIQRGGIPSLDNLILNVQLAAQHIRPYVHLAQFY